MGGSGLTAPTTLARAERRRSRSKECLRPNVGRLAGTTRLTNAPDANVTERGDNVGGFRARLRACVKTLLALQTNVRRSFQRAARIIQRALLDVGNKARCPGVSAAIESPP